MSSSLHAIAVKLPSPHNAPCDLVATVTVENAGNDAADGLWFDVTIDLAASADGPVTDTFSSIVFNPENARLGAGKTIIVPVTIRLPCSGPVWLKTIANKDGTVPNDDRTLPAHVLIVTPAPVPWLAASVRLGLRDGAGLLTMDPPSLCPGLTLVVAVTTENSGCAPSLFTKNEVRVEQFGPGSLNTLLAQQTYSVPAIKEHDQHVTTLDFPLPGPAAVPATLMVTVTADVGGANQLQCDRSRLVAATSKPLQSGSAPRLSLTSASATIRPGESTVLAWSVSNDCTEIGLATIRILLGASALEIYRNARLIGPHATVDGSVTVDGTLLSTGPMKNAFWTIGAKALTLEVLGAGASGGPYTTTLALAVVPEPIDGSLWTWISGTSFLWKRGYAVRGNFINPSRSAPVSLTALTAVEHPTDVVGTGSDVTRSPTSIPTSIAPGAIGPAVTWGLIQTWNWTSDSSTPTRRVFRYVATFTAMDTFTNTYTGLVSAPFDVTVAVSPIKIMARQIATAYFAIGANMVAGGLAVVYWLPLVGIASIIIGMAFLIGATLYLADANDPPVPDFGSQFRIVPDVEQWKLGTDDQPNLHALRTLLLLCGRCFRARSEALHARDRAWAAYIERDEERWTHACELVRFHQETMRRCVEAIAAAADESSSIWAEIAAEARARARTQTNPAWDGSREGMSKALRSFAAEFGLPEHERAILEEGVGWIDERQIASALDNFLDTGFTEIAPAFSALYDLTVSALAEGEYLRHA